MRTTNPNLEFPKATFTEPTPYGYIYAGIIVDPPGRAPFVRGSSKRNDALERSKTVARRLEELDEVIKATVYRAVLIPPIEGMPRFDVIVLVQTTSPETISEVQTSEPYERLDADFVMAARNTRRIGDTEVPLSGSFLFNHFTAEDPEARWRCGRASPDGTPLRSAWIIPPCCNPSARRLMLSSTTCACHAGRSGSCSISSPDRASNGLSGPISARMAWEPYLCFASPSEDKE